MTAAELAAAFSPVLLLTDDQRWTPIAVEDYVRGALVTDWEGRRNVVQTVEELDTDCPGVVKSPCYVLRQACASHTTEGHAQCAEDLPDDKAVSVRVARRKDWRGCARPKPCVDGSSDPFAAGRGRVRPRPGHPRAVLILLPLQRVDRARCGW
jgi:hypothetical protein